MTAQAIQIEGKDYVIVPRDEFDRFDRLRSLYDSSDLPELPEPNEKGLYPAIEYCRISLARKIIRDRVSLGLLPEDLARLAGVRLATLRRIESGAATPSVASIERIDAALKAAQKKPRAKLH